MKRNLRSCIIAIAAIAVVYTSCKKDSPDFGDNGGSTVSSKDVSQQIALNIAQSFYGGMGGFDLSEGMDPQINAIAPGRKKIVINSVNSGCGIAMDTTMNFSMDLDTMSMSVGGRFKVSSTCVNGQPSSIAMYDSLLVSMTTLSLAAKYNILQNLTVTSQDPANDNAKLTFSGIMNMKAELEYKKGSKPKLNTTFNYKLTSLVIDPVKDGDIISGSATFETIGDTPQGKWNYKGSIQFLGDHKVKITINGDVYTVNIQTGQIV